MTDQLHADNPPLQPGDLERSSGWARWRDYLEPRGLLRPNTEPCTCRYCEMTEAEIEEYRREVRGKHGEQR
jgi:hypothetical protein